jgi:hypothetical protein
LCCGGRTRDVRLEDFLYADLVGRQQTMAAISPLRLPPSSRKTGDWVATNWSNSQSVRLSSRISPVVDDRRPVAPISAPRESIRGPLTLTKIKLVNPTTQMCERGSP